MIAWGREKSIALRDASRTFIQALWLVVRSVPVEGSVLFGMLFVQGIIPPLNVLILKSILDTLGQPTHGQQLGWLFVGWTILLSALYLLRQWTLLVQASVNEQFTAAIEQQLIRQANRIPNLAVFENPAFYDDLQMLTRLAPHRPTNFIATTAQIIPNLIATIGLVIVLAPYGWWIPALLIVTIIPYGAVNLRLQRESWQTIIAQNPWTRAMRYFCGLSTGIQGAKEIRLYNAGSLFEAKYETAFHQLVTQSRKDRLGYALTPLLVTIGFVGVHLWTLWWFIRQATDATTALSTVVFGMQAIVLLQENLGGLSGMVALLGGHLVFFERFTAFQRLSVAPFRTDGSHPVGPLTEGIVFDHVSFAYSNGAPVLHDVSLTLHAGETVAIVGENGAGKTTLVKLLCRLYDPTSGTICADSVDLRDLDVTQWRNQLSSVFQDFGRYHLTLEENITLSMHATHASRFAAASAGAGLTPHLEQLADRESTQLGVEFGGVDLSGGQWQTIAIARALYRDTPILILDEPTSALDPRTEAELYQRFNQLAAGRTTLLITHRLASVQMADRIIVLKAGRIIEQGTHAALMALGGEYATLYQLQASHYYQAHATEQGLAP